MTKDEPAYHIPALAARILSRLESELPANLVFHSAKHARDVLSEAVLFAREDAIPSRLIELLAVAAAFHDAGFLRDPSQHEMHSAAMATEAMFADGGYTDDEIRSVEGMILDTQTQPSGALHRPRSAVSRYLLDGDVSNFGREDFFDKLALLAEESGLPLATAERAALDLLDRHEWLTPAAAKLRGPGKVNNLALLRARISPR